MLVYLTSALASAGVWDSAALMASMNFSGVYMSKSNDLYWADQNRKMLKARYDAHLEKYGLENTFDNCYDFVCNEYGQRNLKKDFCVSTDVELAKIISGEEPNDYSF